MNDLRLDKDGALWVSTDGGLSRLKDGHVATLTSKNGLPCDAVLWMLEDAEQSVWLGMPCGLARVAKSDRAAWIADPRHALNPTFFDSSDGARMPALASAFGPRVTRSLDGKLWFLTDTTVSVVDPGHLAFNKLPPPVHIEQIVADRKMYEVSSNGNLHLPARTRDLEIDYTALSFTDRERSRFRYKLEGRDPDWVDAGSRCQAFYNDLPPRSYRFRVIACNNDGVWNETGASIEFSVAPAYYQTTWFRASAVAAFLALLWGLYRLRLQQMIQHFNIRIQATVDERTRIARDLHDTLLQSFQGVLLKFHAVTYMLTDRPEAQKKLESVIDQARAAIAEGRDAVQGLRSSPLGIVDLAQAIGTLGEELASSQSGAESMDFAMQFDVQEEGTPRELVPMVRDEVYSVSAEAMRNAFKHAGARRIEVEIRYDPLAVSRPDSRRRQGHRPRGAPRRQAGGSLWRAGDARAGRAHRC